ncbi:MAG: hypothetical protein NC341_04960 [Blautia sp.]|nr:hypothetical protein [Blautia sp.]MCM1199704.1 hypothetical protein [Bacteroides fragilis]
MFAFLIWLFVGILFLSRGIHAFFTKKAVPFGFWANAETFAVKDVKAYNRAVGKLWCVFGVVFALLGIPLLKGQNTPCIILSILGIMAEAIAAMVVYVTVIEKKYREK